MKYFWIILFLAVSLEAQEVIKSSGVLNYTYLIYLENMTTANKTAIKNMVVPSKSSWQPSARFQAYGNSIFCLFKENYTNLTFDSTTTRVLVTIDAQYDSTFQSLVTGGKVVRISRLNFKIVDDIKQHKKDYYSTWVDKYMDYLPKQSNTDFCLHIDTGVDPRW